MCGECQRREAANRLLWSKIRRHLLGIVRALDERYGTAEAQDRRAA